MCRTVPSKPQSGIVRLELRVWSLPANEPRDRYSAMRRRILASERCADPTSYIERAQNHGEVNRKKKWQSVAPDVPCVGVVTEEQASCCTDRQHVNTRSGMPANRIGKVLY